MKKNEKIEDLYDMAKKARRDGIEEGMNICMESVIKKKDAHIRFLQGNLEDAYIELEKLVKNIDMLIKDIDDLALIIKDRDNKDSRIRLQVPAVPKKKLN